MFYKQNKKHASAYILMSGLMFAFMGASIKFVSDDVSTELIVFFRNLFGFAVILPFVLLSVFKTGLSSLATDVPWWHLGRSLAGLGAMYLFFYAIAYIPLSEAVLLSYTTPLFAPLLAWFLLKEAVSRNLVFAIALGFVGVTFLLNPNFEAFSWVSLIALGSGLMAAAAMTAIRRMSKTEPATRIIFYYGLICTSVSSIPLLGIEKMPDTDSMLILVAVGIFATLGQFCLTRGYSTAPVAQVGPFVYSTVVFATIIGWFFWEEMPTAYTGFGILLVIVAGSIALGKSAEAKSS